MNGNVPRVDGVPITRYWLIPAERAAEDVHSARDHDHGGDPRADAGGLGQLLQPAGDLEPVEVRAHAARPAGVPVHLQVVSPDVREHGHFDRQRPSAEGDAGGALAGGAVPEVIRSEADAGARNADLAEVFGVDFDYVLRRCERTLEGLRRQEQELCREPTIPKSRL